MTLKFLYKDSKEKIIEYIKKDNKKVSTIITGTPMKFLYGFLCMEPEIYDLLDQEAKTLLAAPYEKKNFLML